MARDIAPRTCRLLFATLILISLAMPACESSDSVNATSATTTPTTVSADTVSPTTAPPTTVVPETTAAASEIIEITLDGGGCTASEPTVVLAGVQSFVVRDLTGERVSDMRTMVIADGHSYEDLVDLQGESGEYVALPDWAEWPLTAFDPVDRDLAENELGKKLILDPGEHGITIRTDEGVWLCGALEVTES